MAEERVNKKLIAKNSIYLAIRMVIVTLISIFTTRYLLNNLGVEDYGVYNVTLGIVMMCTFLSPSLSNAIQRFYSYELGKNGAEGATKVLNTGLLIQIAMVLLIIVVAETIGLWYVNNYLVIPEGRETAVFWVYEISVVAISLSMLQVPFMAAIMAHEKMNYFALINILDAVLKLCIAIAIKYSSFDRLIFYGILLLTIYIIDFFAYSVYCFLKFSETRIDLKLNKGLLKSIGSFTGWNLFETVARMFKDQGCNLLFNFFYGPVVNAARGVANQVTYAFTSIVESTIMASRPQMVQSYARGDVNSSIKIFYTLSKCTLFLIFIVSLPVFIDIDYILKLWLGESVPDYAALLVRLSILVVLVDKLASPVTALIHATGNIKKYHISSGIINIIVLPVSFLILYLGGNVTMVYVATILFTIVAQTIFLYIVKRQLNISLRTYVFEVVIRFIATLPAVIAPVLVFMHMPSSFLRLVLIIMASLVASLLSVFYLGLNSREKQLLLSIVKKK